MPASRFIIPALLAILILSCEKKKVSYQELMDYTLDVDHGLVKEERKDDIVAKMTFHPADLMIAREINGSGLDSTKWKKLRAKYQDQYYFILSLSQNGREVVNANEMSSTEFSELLQTISFRMSVFTNLTTSQSDTLQLSDYAFTRTFGMSASTDLLLVFDKRKIKDRNWIQINLKEFGLGLGLTSFRFRKEDIENVPQIDFQKFSNTDL